MNNAELTFNGKFEMGKPINSTSVDIQYNQLCRIVLFVFTNFECGGGGANETEENII